MSDTRVENVFSAALQKASPLERDAYLEGACQRDADLRARVETLLRAHEEAKGFLTPAVTNEPVSEGQGTIIGRYKLLQLIGEGGFGVVYMAEQFEPLRRKVALKIIKLGMDTRQVVARFESERQALALMDHPNIARVFDGGSTDSGRPFFVMELVKGIPITEYCDQNNLTLQERMKLFLPVCQAVQHAHQKGIIHRDIKPSNVLVTSHDGSPVPKVIDFGIAKATNQRLTEKTLFTEFRQFIGTPQYMSPEQAEMSGLDVDTRSDIYSLGVMLFELMTGTTPFEAERLRTAGYSEMQRIIREEEPPSPSQRVSTLGEQLVQIAKRRHVEPGSLPREFRGELDWIVMKALEKDRTRRYSTASDLGADVQRYISHELVQAGPPSTIYKLRKFVRRNRMAVSVASVISITLLIGIALASVGLMQARREAARSQAIADFLQEILSASDPRAAAAQNIDVSQVASRCRELFGEDHASLASILTSLGIQLERSGKFDAAETSYRESVRLWKELYGNQHAQVGIALSHLGSLLHLKGNDVEAEPILRDAIQITDGLPNQARLVSSDARKQLAEIVKQHGMLDEAEKLLRESLKIRRRFPKGQEYAIGSDLEHLTGVLSLAGKDEEAEKTFHEMMAAFRPMFSPDSLPLAWQSASFGLWLRQRGKLEKAEPHFREAVRIYRLNSNPPRDLYLASLDGLFQSIRRRDEAFEETISLFHECLENMTYLYGRDHLLLAPQLFGFAKELEERNRYAEAIPLLLDGIRIARKASDPPWDASASLKMLDRFVEQVALPAGQPKERYQAAAQGAETLIVEFPDQPRGFKLLGIAKYRLGEWEDARGNLLKATSMGTNAVDPISQAFLAMAQFQLGQKSAATQTFAPIRSAEAANRAALTKQDRAIVLEAESLIAGQPSTN